MLLKFVIFDFKETKISFEELADSPIKIVVPTGTYEISESLSSFSDTKCQEKTDTDPFIYSKSDRCVILNFKWENTEEIQKLIENSNNENNVSMVIRFKIKADYYRLEQKSLCYNMEIKFKI